MNCSGLSHSLFGTPNKRTTFICIQMIAEALANSYFWNRLLVKHPKYNIDVRVLKIPDEWALSVIDSDELTELKLLESYAAARKHYAKVIEPVVDMLSEERSYGINNKTNIEV